MGSTSPPWTPARGRSRPTTTSSTGLALVQTPERRPTIPALLSWGTLTPGHPRASVPQCKSPTTLCTTAARGRIRSEEHTSELQSRPHLVCRLLLEKKKQTTTDHTPLPSHGPTRTILSP